MFTVLVQNSGHVDDDIPIYALDVFKEMDGRKSRYTKKVLDSYREEYARDPSGTELSESIENMAAISILRCILLDEQGLWAIDTQVNRSS